MGSNSGPATASTRVGIWARLRAFIQRSISPFWLSFALILTAEAVTILVAWQLLDVGANIWIQQKAAQAVYYAEQTAHGGDWSRIDEIRSDQDSAVFKEYKKRLDRLSKKYFPRNEGMVYIVVVNKKGRELQVAPNDDTPLDDMRKADQWEVAAYTTGETTYSSIPMVTENTGTYIAAYVPVPKSGHIIGLIAAEYDEAPMTDFQGIIRLTFWLSLAPAILISLVVALVLAGWLVEPGEVLRTIADPWSATDEEKWGHLTDRQKELANLLRQGIGSDKELASAMGLKPSTVADYVKQVTKNTGWSRLQLALAAARRRSSATP